MKHASLVILGLIFAVGPSMCNQDCHKKILEVNNSDQTVIFANSFFSPPNGKCSLDGEPLAPGKTREYFPYSTRTCIKDRLESGITGEVISIYIIDPSQFNEPNTYYSCDSIEVNNKILKRYELTLDDLKQNDFTVTYP